jgi:hypothetical protein
MSDKPVFDVNKSMFDKLKTWQEKMEEKNREEAEEEVEKKPQAETRKSSEEN